MSAAVVVLQPRATLDTVLAIVLDAVPNLETRRHYETALAEFLHWRAAQQIPFGRASVMRWRAELVARGLSPATVNQRLAAVRKLAREAHYAGYLDAETAAQVTSVESVRQAGVRSGNWLTQDQAQRLILAPQPTTAKGLRDRVALALLVGCGLRRSEAANLTVEHLEQRDGRWVILDLVGKRQRIRTIPVPAWVKAAIDAWVEEAHIFEGRILRAMNRHGFIVGESMSGNAVLDLAVRYGREIGVEIKPHDLRRTCAKLCRKAGGGLEQIQMLLGHSSVQTTERYLGTKQDLENAPNDRLGLGWKEGA